LPHIHLPDEHQISGEEYQRILLFRVVPVNPHSRALVGQFEKESNWVRRRRRRKPLQGACLKRLSSMCIMNADDHERHGRRDVHDRVFLNCQHEHDRENGHGHAHARGYGPSQSRGHAGGCAGADVRGSLSWCLQYLESFLSNPLTKVYQSGLLLFKLTHYQPCTERTQSYCEGSASKNGT
jgi:hypothetical protein